MRQKILGLGAVHRMERLLLLGAGRVKLPVAALALLHAFQKRRKAVGRLEQLLLGGA